MASDYETVSSDLARGVTTYFRRHVLAPALIAVGADKLLIGTAKYRRLILCYHGVTDSGQQINARHISAKKFEAHMQYLRSRFDVVPLANLFKTDDPGSDKRQVAVTFDDGFRNNRTTALPILERYGVPATIFVSGCCATGEATVLWSDLLDCLRHHVYPNGIVLNDRLYTGTKWAYQLRDEEGRGLYDVVKLMSPDERKESFDALHRRYPIAQILNQTHEDLWRLMGPDDVLAVGSSELIAIGSHGHRHFNLADLGNDDALEELSNSKKALESVLGSPVTSIAFPDGSYSETTKALSIQVGYDQLLAVDYRLDSDSTDRSILRRSMVPNVTSLASQQLFLGASFRKGI